MKVRELRECLDGLDDEMVVGIEITDETGDGVSAPIVGLQHCLPFGPDEPGLMLVGRDVG